MTLSNSSLTYWTDKEIYPNGIFLTTSGSGGDRLLFWQPAPHRREDKTGSQKHESGAPELAVSQSTNRETAAQNDCGSMGPSASTDKTSPRVEPAHNPFALHLITDRPPGAVDLSPGGTAVGTASLLTVGTGPDRVLGNTPIATSGFGSSGATTVVTSSASGVNTCGTVVSTGSSYPHSPGDTNPSTLADGGLEHKALLGANGISTIEGLPANLVLSLLHQQFQGLQRKIYTKLDYHVFVGAAFNVTPTREETGDAASATSPSNSDTTRAGRSMISFAVVFSMDASASPSVLSYYTELARLIASQIRRAELISDYLTNQRDFIVSLMDRSSPGFCSTGDYTQLEGTDSETVPRDHTSQQPSSRRPPKLGSLVENNSSAPGGPTDWKRLGYMTENKATGFTECPSTGRRSDVGISTPFEQLVAVSSLCRELKTVIDSVCLSGHVSVMINKIHPVFFSLPHKAYSVTFKQANGPLPAIRPAAVWRAMDKIRPYHTLLLLPRKQDLLQQQLPQDINEAMVDFISDLSSSASLSDLALRTQSQMHCLTLALWLIYQGHAIIIYPIVANNTYVLSPHYAAWFDAALVAQFATRFPDCNLAKLLASFSTGLTLKEHLGNRNTENGTTKHGASVVPPANDPDAFWTELSYTNKVELITWLLRRRLIIQVHVYVFSTLTSETLKQTKGGQESNERLSSIQENSLQDDSTTSFNSFPVCSMYPQSPAKSPQMDSVLHQRIPRSQLPQDVVTKLCSLFPTDCHKAVLETLIRHPGATQNIALLQLFVLILPHLPAHLEELMFHVGVSRATLVECIERFSPILSTAKLPDPVTACFSGVDWPD